MSSLKEKVFALVELLPSGNDYLGFDDGRIPLLNGKWLWQEVERRQLTLAVPPEYTEAFKSLVFLEEKVVTREAGYSQSYTKGFEEDYIPEASYLRLVPDLTNWTLPVKPEPGLTKESILKSLLWRVIKTMPEFSLIETQVWEEWLKLATPHALPSVEVRKAYEKAEAEAYREKFRKEAEEKKAAEIAAKQLPNGKPRPVIKKRRR